MPFPKKDWVTNPINPIKISGMTVFEISKVEFLKIFPKSNFTILKKRMLSSLIPKTSTRQV
ncbi:hypothetical protein GCM10011346_50880 [Oceanobacillus neutriphilus]|uniref:Uncharacterized protein n=1 Tax=Oceanobacillus neutriphilus TaxID=531815 RepID=A0ABQ2P2U8_9BACI|nr:hypothetical protein GCM10011346_50880 [Oceanobacillus neutriphilus]